MAPKKKGGKKQADDWEAELGELPEAPPEAPNITSEDVNGDAEAVDGGGGLLAALKKNKNKRAKKGKPVDDFVEGEDPPAADEAAGDSILKDKAPEEANLEHDDLFSSTAKKGKPVKKAAEKAAEDAADDGERNEDGSLKSKKEKEKEKKEREKQRKKEQVNYCDCLRLIMILTFLCRLLRRKLLRRHLLRKLNQQNLRQRSRQKRHKLLMRLARKRSFRHIWPLSRNNKRPSKNCEKSKPSLMLRRGRQRRSGSGGKLKRRSARKKLELVKRRRKERRRSS